MSARSASRHTHLPHGDKTDRPRPKVFLGNAAVVRGQARLNRVALANVKPVTLAVFTRAQQQVHARLLQLGLGGHAGLRPGRTREHQRTAHPVGPLDDAQAIGVAVGDEDTEGERSCHVKHPINTISALTLQKYYPPFLGLGTRAPQRFF